MLRLVLLLSATQCVFSSGLPQLPAGLPALPQGAELPQGASQMLQQLAQIPPPSATPVVAAPAAVPAPAPVAPAVSAPAAPITVAPLANDDILTKIPVYKDGKDLVYTVTRKKTIDGILEALGKAKKTVDIAGHILSHPDILKMIQDLKTKGVNVRIFMQKGKALKGLYAAEDNDAAETTFSASVNTKASFLRDIKDKEFRYALQKSAYILIDAEAEGSLAVILTQLPQNTNDKPLISGLFSPNKDLISNLKKIMDSDHEGTPEKTDESVGDFYDSAQIYLGCSPKSLEKIMDFCRESKDTIVVQTASLSDTVFFNFLVKMKEMDRSVKIIVGELTQDRVIENIAFKKGIELRMLPGITGTTILLDPEKDSKQMLMGGFSLSNTDLAYARFVAWSHKDEEANKNADTVFKVLWADAKEMAEVK